ncbi:MAG TPA: glycosyl hydrolase, partial [Gemmatimonadales bacterium]|nr:glycosyl hydrolase [Gemmatimonadales bacterium]
DQGAIVTRNARADDPRDVTWSSWLNQPTAQMYHIAVDYRFPYWVHGAQQDSGSVAVCSRGKFGEISTRDWEPIGGGGESGYTAGDPLHPGIIYGGTGSRFDLALNRTLPGTAQPRGPETGRSDWTQPLVLSPADPKALYYANQYLFKSTDSAQSWTRISNDLTRPDPGIPGNLDAAAAAQVDRNGKRGVIYAIAPSPLLIPMVWVGTDDGLVHLTTDDGGTWRDVTPSAVTAWSRVTMIEASHFDYQSAYVSVDRHQLQDFEPYIYRTRDQGRSWQPIVTGLPAGVYVHTVREDPSRRGLLFAGTERGAWVSFDDGDHWQPLQQNLPVTSVRDFVIYNNDLIVGTHGRGIWVIDDISALRQLTDEVVGSEAWL